MSADQIMQAVKSHVGEVEPSDLIAEFLTHASPISSVSSRDKVNELYQKLILQFPFIWRFSQASIAGFGEEADVSLSLTQVNEWAGLIVWWCRSITNWTKASDPDLRRFCTILMVARYVLPSKRFWDLLPTVAGSHEGFANELAVNIANTRMIFGVKDGGEAPIWEQEGVGKLAKAEERVDVLALSELWRPFKTSFEPAFLQVEMAKCLFNLDQKLLVKAIDRVEQFLVLMGYAYAFDDEQCLLISEASSSNLAKFAFLLFPVERRGRQPFSASNEGLLTLTLISIGKDQSFWRGCMKVLVRYPGRYPGVRFSLGIALSSVSDECRRIFIEEMEIDGGRGGGRLCIGDCLKAFRNVATKEQMASMWHLAFDRWREWDFGSVGAGKIISSIQHSTLDYAVVAYLVECLPKDEAERGVKAIEREILSLGDHWFSGMSEYLSGAYFHLSKYQVYAYAAGCASNGEYLMARGGPLLPRFLAESSYLKTLLRLNVSQMETH